MDQMISRVASLIHQSIKDGGGTALKSEEGGTGFVLGWFMREGCTAER